MAPSNEDILAALAQAKSSLLPLFDHLQEALRRVDELERENHALRNDVRHRAATTIQRCFRRWRILHQVRDMVYELGVRRRLQSRRQSTRTLETESSSDECTPDCYESQATTISEPRRMLLMELERRISDYVDFELLQNGLRRPSGLSDDGTVLHGTPRNTLLIPPIDGKPLTRYPEHGGSYSEEEPHSSRTRSGSSGYHSVLMTPTKEDSEDSAASIKSKRRFAALLDTFRKSPRALFDRDESSSKHV